MTKLSDVSDASNPVFELNNTAGVSFHTIGTRTFLCVVGDDDFGLSVFEVSESGALTHVTSLDVINQNSSSFNSIATGTVHGKDYLIAPDHYEGHFIVYELGANGVPTHKDTFDAYNNTPDDVWGNRSVEFIVVDGIPLLLSQGEESDTVDLYSLDSAGKMSHVKSLSSHLLNGARGVEHVSMGGNDFIVAAAHDAHRVTVLGIGTDDDLLRGTASGDTLLGFAGDDDLVGRAGNDLLKGGSGEDVLSGGLGDDQLLGGTGEDVLAGGRGDDVLEGGNGADVLVGGQGLDLASYADAAQGVTVSLNGAGAGTSDAKADIFQGIEGLVGSKFRDDLTVHDRVPTWTHFCPRS